MRYSAYPYFSAVSLARCSLIILLSSKSHLFPHNTTSGSSQYACVYKRTRHKDLFHEYHCTQSWHTFLHLGILNLHLSICRYHKAKEIVTVVILVTILTIIPVVNMDGSYDYHSNSSHFASLCICYICITDFRK